ncbi:MAG: hypothetical protein WHS88_05800 [Anaerohalosphaeraceae bacterium]
MEQNVKILAVYSAVFVFFLMAAAGWLFGCSPAVCASRALAGAVVMYAVVQFCGRMVIRILLDAIVESQLRKQTDRDRQ